MPGYTLQDQGLWGAVRTERNQVCDGEACHDPTGTMFGIFAVALPVIYGEGHQAVGRLLEHVLTRPDNVTILAWTGTLGGHHSHLPSSLIVYDQVLPPHVPQAI